MSYLNVLEKTSFPERWLIVKHSQDFVKADSTLLILKLYVVRFLATLFTAAVWVTFTLSTGIFTVGTVILFGAAIGSSHFLLHQKPHRFHFFFLMYLQPSAKHKKHSYVNILGKKLVP